MTPSLAFHIPFEKPKIQKIKFSAYEDSVIKTLVNQMGSNPNWDFISSVLKTRTPRQCKDRWTCYLNPNVNLGEWTKEEDELLQKKVAQYGQKWKYLVQFFNMRSEVNLKNRFKLLKRREEKQIKEKVESEKLMMKSLLPSLPSIIPGYVERSKVCVPFPVTSFAYQSPVITPPSPNVSPTQQSLQSSPDVDSFPVPNSPLNYSYNEFEFEDFMPEFQW